MLKLAFRADGGKEIGMGHLMRCLALAKAFPDDVDIRFITKSDAEGINVIKQKGYKVIPFSSDSLQKEIKYIEKKIINNNIDIIITDSYELDYDYLNSLKKVVNKLISIHDFAPYPFPSDIVINGNVYALDLQYESLTKNSKFLLGTKYLLMRNEFVGLAKRILNKEVKRILITVGGGDPLNLTPRIIAGINSIRESGLINIDNIYIDIVIGPAFDNIAEIIESLKKANIEISLHFNVNRISDLMLKSDLAVSAGGSTLYELAATGTPTVAILQADNQVQGAQVMEERGIIINLGMGDQVKAETIAEKIGYLINNFELRKRMSREGQKLVDGNGVSRCVKEILS